MTSAAAAGRDAPPEGDGAAPAPPAGESLEDALQDDPFSAAAAAGGSPAASGKDKGGKPPASLHELLREEYEQRSKFKKYLFYGGAVVAAIVLIFFLCFMCCSERPLQMLAVSPLAAVPLGVFGLVPIAIIYVMFKSVYGARIVDGRDLNVAHKLADLLTR